MRLGRLIRGQLLPIKPRSWVFPEVMEAGSSDVIRSAGLQGNSGSSVEAG